MRRFYFWFLSLGFFILTPLIIIYSLGYRYSFDRGIFIFSGSITLKTNPEQVSIEINKEPVSSKKINYFNKSYHIDGLNPGEYSIRVHRDGFQDWKKTITVQSGISTEFWNVLLPRSDYAVTQYTGTESITRFFPSPKDTLFAVAKQPAQNPYSLQISVTDADSNVSQELYTSDSARLIPDTLQNIEWSPKEDFLLVPLELPTDSPEEKTKISTESTGNKTPYIILSVDSQTNLRWLNEFLPKNWVPQNARWSPSEQETIYFTFNESLWKISVKEEETKNTTPTLIAENILGYDFYTDNIVILRKENHIFYHYGITDSDEPRQITTIPLPEENNLPHRIIVYDDRKIATINSERELFIHNTFEDKTFTKKLASSIDGAQFSDDGKKLLFWNDHEVFLYFMEKWETQPQRSEDTLIQIARFFDPVSNVQWAKDYEHILFNQEREVKILDLDTRGGQKAFILKTITLPHPRLFMSGRDDKIYYTDEQDERTHLFSFDFPEPKSFLGL